MLDFKHYCWLSSSICPWTCDYIKPFAWLKLQCSISNAENILVWSGRGFFSGHGVMDIRIVLQSSASWTSDSVGGWWDRKNTVWSEITSRKLNKRLIISDLKRLAYCLRYVWQSLFYISETLTFLSLKTFSTISSFFMRISFKYIFLLAFVFSVERKTKVLSLITDHYRSAEPHNRVSHTSLDTFWFNVPVCIR